MNTNFEMSMDDLQRMLNQAVLPKERTCAHDACTDCNGTGVKANGSICIHFIACNCSKCSPQYL